MGRIKSFFKFLWGFKFIIMIILISLAFAAAIWLHLIILIESASLDTGSLTIYDKEAYVVTGIFLLLLYTASALLWMKIAHICIKIIYKDIKKSKE